MILITSDEKRFVDIGNFEIWHSLYSTVAIRLEDFVQAVPNAFLFLKNGQCKSADAIKTAKEINLIRDRLAAVAPEEAVFDLKNPAQEAPWKDDLSPVITSCNTLFTTADGKDLLYEIVSILCYAGIKKVDVKQQ